MPPVGFEPTISAGERPQTYALDRVATGHRNNTLIHIQRDATLHYLYLEAAVHVLGGTITHHQEHMQLYLQHLVFVKRLLLPAVIVEELELV